VFEDRAGLPTVGKTHNWQLSPVLKDLGSIASYPARAVAAVPAPPPTSACCPQHMQLAKCYYSQVSKRHAGLQEDWVRMPGRPLRPAGPQLIDMQPVVPHWAPNGAPQAHVVAVDAAGQQAHEAPSRLRAERRCTQLLWAHKVCPQNQHCMGLQSAPCCHCYSRQLQVRRRLRCTGLLTLACAQSPQAPQRDPHSKTCCVDSSVRTPCCVALRPCSLPTLLLVPYWGVVGRYILSASQATSRQAHCRR
jgi:hypothetical protein